MVWPKAFRPILNPLAVIVYQCVRAGVALEKCCGDGLLADCVRSYARVGGVDDEERTLRARLGAWLGGTLSAGGVLGVIALAVTDHRHWAVMLLVAVLVGMGVVRMWTPGRPWFASRGRVADTVVYVILAAIIWYLAPFVSTMAVH